MSITLGIDWKVVMALEMQVEVQSIANAFNRLQRDSFPYSATRAHECDLFGIAR
jgi:hypothetical protein